ncbi:MAG: hypothetical protein VX958_02485, partial [Planctomycetota bacterium]|nr:hypothetical protein [Planctomycetota bacterium]
RRGPRRGCRWGLPPLRTAADSARAAWLGAEPFRAAAPCENLVLPAAMPYHARLFWFDGPCRSRDDPVRV